ncbi:toprim domain-containing protein, partial [Stenotrophomonas maltophilia]
PEARVWAATSLGNLANVPVEHPCVSAVVVAQDNDWGKAQAVDAFNAAIERMEAAGRPVSVLRSHWGKDVN